LRQFARRGGAADGQLTVQQRRALADLSACRTAQLGGRLERCSACGHQEYLYNSCRNRHCPRCQAGSRAAWLEREAGYLLPVEYHHLVFTLPGALQDVAADNPRLVYGLLFEAASSAVQHLAADPKYLGAQVGLVAVLHTWGQTLSLHPHLHVLATGGGLSCNRAGQIDETPRWQSSRPGFFLPVRVLGRLFRGKFLAGLAQAHKQGKLFLRVGQAPLAALLAELYRQDWVVYSQPPCAGAEVVLKYLARYVHRVAISNSRLVRASAEEVTFRYKDYRRQGQHKEMTLSIEEFGRRFLQHVLPLGFVRIRHYGLLANRGREEKLQVCRRLLLVEHAQEAAPTAKPAEQAEAESRCCRACGEGVMEFVEALPRQPHAAIAEPARQDSS
jgi:Putative transposase/Transposase zinc-binding domain